MIYQRGGRPTFAVTRPKTVLVRDPQTTAGQLVQHDLDSGMQLVIFDSGGPAHASMSCGGVDFLDSLPTPKLSNHVAKGSRVVAITRILSVSICRRLSPITVAPNLPFALVEPAPSL